MITCVMIYIFHKMLALLKKQLNYIKDSIFEYFFKECNRFVIIFFTTYNDGKFNS